MNPKIWGKGFWYLIFIILYNIDEFGGLEKVKEYLDLIIRILPCVKCKKHALEKMEQNNVISDDNIENIRRTFIDIYNTFAINKIVVRN